MPKRLRRTSANPYRTFLFLIIIDFASLLLVFTLVLSNHIPSQITINNLFVVAKDLFQFRQLLKIIEGQSLTVYQILSGCAGLLFYLAYIRILMRFKDFKQHDDDRVWLAHQNNLLGNFSTSIRILEQIKINTRESKINCIIALLGVDQLIKAKDEAIKLIELINEKQEKDFLFRILVDCTILTKIPKKTIISLIEDGVLCEVSDVTMQDILSFMLITRPEIFKEITSILMAKNDKYPLSIAILKLHENKTEEACELLESTMPGKEIEEITRFMLHLRAKLQDSNSVEEEDLRYFKMWINKYYSVVIDLLVQINEPIEVALAFGHIMFLRVLSRSFVVELEEQLIYHGDQLKKKVIGNSQSEILMRAIEIRFNELV